MATDLSKFSDDDLQKIAAQAKPAAGKYDSYSDEDLMKIAGSKPDPYSKLGSVGMGAVQGATLGYAPQIYGGLAKLAQVTGLGGEDYEKARDEAAGKFAQAKNDNPYSYMAGNVAGAVPLFATGAGEALGIGGEATGLLNAGLRGAKAGGLIGLVQNPGESKTGDSLQIGERLNNGIMGAGLGGLVGSGGKYLMDAAETTGMAGLLKNAPQSVKSMLQGKLSSSAQGIQNRVIDPSMESAEKALSSVNIPYNTNKLLSFTDKAVHPVTGEVLQTPSFPGVVSTGTAEDLPLPGSQALAYRQKLDQLTNWSRRPGVSDASKASNEVAEGLANELRGKIADASPEAAQSLSRAEQGIGAKTDIEDMMRDPISKFNARLGGLHGGDTAPKLALADEMAGSDLLSTARTVGKATHINQPIPSDITRLPGWLASQALTRVPGTLTQAATSPIPYVGGQVPYSAIMQSLIADRLRSMGQ